ncbi:MAG: hypothetical protein HQM10_23315 [Candidatus Riflebacteria bacterium]|nr:hypothetical protein [Candidatus Riflebacteria bacterium]
MKRYIIFGLISFLALAPELAHAGTSSHKNKCANKSNLNSVRYDPTAGIDEWGHGNDADPGDHHSYPPPTPNSGSGNSGSNSTTPNGSGDSWGHNNDTDPGDHHSYPPPTPNSGSGNSGSNSTTPNGSGDSWGHNNDEDPGNHHTYPPSYDNPAPKPSPKPTQPSGDSWDNGSSGWEHNNDGEIYGG